MVNIYILLLLALTANEIFSEASTTGQPSCIDEDGNSVDWFIAYKFPKLDNKGWPFNTGYANAYITSNSFKIRNKRWTSREVEDNRTREVVSNPKASIKQRAEEKLYWTISGKVLTDPKSLVLRTLAIAYERKTSGSNVNSLFYNDGPPDDETGNKTKASSSLKAHAKGALVIDDVSGKSFWLTHSVPEFPPPRQQDLKFHKNSVVYGQTFMCLSFDLHQAGEQVVKHLITMRPLVYDYYISDKLYSLIPDIQELTGEKKPNRRNSTRTKLSQVITTRDGQRLSIFSKGPDFAEDLYSDWMNDDLETSLYVESWRKGSGTPLNSSCPRDDFHVNNVQDMQLDLGQKKNITWSYLQDHSKWAISEEKNPGFVCISDINRMESQFKRGGGAVCIKCPSCWSVFSSTILDVEPCKFDFKSRPQNGNNTSTNRTTISNSTQDNHKRHRHRNH